MKKILLLALTSVSLLSFASDFQVIINKKSSSYESGTESWIQKDIKYTSWLNTGSEYNCEDWTPSSEKQKIDYIQSSICDQNQERKKQYIEEDVFSGKTRVSKEETEYRNIKQTKNRDITVYSDSPILIGSSFDCAVWIPSISTAYYGELLDQNRTCNGNMGQDYTHKFEEMEINNFTDYFLSTDYEESQSVTGVKKHNINVVSCGYDNKLNGLCKNSRIETSFEYNNNARGWSLLILNPIDYTLRSYNHYDTHLTPSLATDMANKINSAKNGDLVVIGTYDQPSYINSDLINSMGTHLKSNTTFLNDIALLGYPNSDNIRYRSSYAIISYKGGKKINEDFGYRYDDSSVSALLPE